MGVSLGMGAWAGSLLVLVAFAEGVGGHAEGPGLHASRDERADVAAVHGHACELQKDLPKAERVTVRGTTHALALENPAAFNEEVLRSLGTQ